MVVAGRLGRRGRPRAYPWHCAVADYGAAFHQDRDARLGCAWGHPDQPDDSRSGYFPGQG